MVAHFLGHPEAEVPPGAAIGRYEIKRLIGRGGMGAVYEATDPRLRREVAIKILPSSRSSDDFVRQRFLREAQLAARLNHPNTVTVYEIDNDESIYYIVMELVNGLGGQELIAGNKRLDCREATSAMIDACRGLAAAHDAGMIHRDIKPANLLWSSNGSVKVSDFGLAKPVVSDDPSITRGDGFVGTPLYMSPEQARKGDADQRSDIYSLGATYFALLAGRAPYCEGDAMDVLYAHCAAPVPEVRQVCPDLPVLCSNVIRKAMAKEPGDRYQHVVEMLADLQAVMLLFDFSPHSLPPDLTQERTYAGISPTPPSRPGIAVPQQPQRSVPDAGLPPALDDVGRAGPQGGEFIVAALLAEPTGDTTGEDGWPAIAELAGEFLIALADPEMPERMANLAGELQVAIDRLVGRELTVIMAHPSFRRLEATWLGIRHLTDTLAKYPVPGCEIQIADYSASDLLGDVNDAKGAQGGITSSWLFKTLHRDALDTRGGKPFGLIVSGIEFGGDASCSDSRDGSPLWGNDSSGGLNTLSLAATVFEMGFCPFVASASPVLLGQRNFSQLSDCPDLALSRSAVQSFGDFRKEPRARFVGLVAPRIVLRPALAGSSSGSRWFRQPSISNPASVTMANEPLLGSAVFALGAIVIRSMREGWPTNIQGAFARGDDLDSSGGVVLLSTSDFETDAPGLCPRIQTEIALTGPQERQLGQMGLIALSTVSHYRRGAFFSLRMVQQPPDPAGRVVHATDELHASLPHILVASRFAQWAKVYARNRQESFQEADELKSELETVIRARYVGEKLPLRAFEVTAARRGDGTFDCVLNISPRLTAEDVEVIGIIPLRLNLVNGQNIGLAGESAVA